jgi:glutamate-ammonia-ligase adenylyltransferase
VQYLQLRHGRGDASLRTPNTLEALAVLDAARLLHPEHAATLTDSYRFLRRVENRLRIVADLSVNTLPSSPAKLEKLAKRMGYHRTAGAAHEQFLADYAAHTSRVRGIFKQVLGAE